MEKRDNTNDSGIVYTDDQNAAVNSYGKTVVSASAGSGKTFVMIEKICDIIEKGKLDSDGKREKERGDLDNLLAITFTRKAATQMKEKLQNNLTKRLVAHINSESQDDENSETIKHLQKQVNKAATADVCTIHVFCSRLIRTYFYAADINGIDSSFTVVDDDEAKSQRIQNRVINDIFRKKYAENDNDFTFLVSCYRKGRSDSDLKEKIKKIHQDLRNIPDYQYKLNHYAEVCDEARFDSIAKEFYDRRVSVCKSILDDMKSVQLAFPVENNEAKSKCDYVYSEIEKNVSAFLNSGNIFVKLPSEIVKINLKTISAGKNKNDKETIPQVKDFIKRTRSRWKKIYLDVDDEKTEREKFLSGRRLAKTLCDLVLEYDSELSEARGRENILDYSDLEQYALKILDEKNTDILNYIHGKYKYIFVDEFQDVNGVQDEIIKRLAGDDTEVFYVGDYKQSIYAFRGSNPDIFQRTFDLFKGNKVSHKGNFNPLTLTDNFRSDEIIVKAVNDIFSQAMHDGVSKTNYNAVNENGEHTHWMKYGGLYNGTGLGRVEVDYYLKDSGDSKRESSEMPVYSVKSDFEGLHKLRECNNQGHAIALIIKEELSKTIYDIVEKRERLVEPRDICILVRKQNNKTILKMLDYLRENGCPVSGINDTDVLEQSEIRCLRNILSCIDNPEQDFPLCAFLLSPLGGMNEDDLARIRLDTSASTTFRARVNKYILTNEGRDDDGLSEKLDNALKNLRRYRNLSETVGVSGLIDMICSDAGWTLKYEKDGGAILRSIRNLQSLAFSDGHEMSISEFLRYLDASNLKIEAPDLARANCVQVMTMHKAKGLEFPVVIIANISQGFGGGDQRNKPIDFDKELGFAPNGCIEGTMKYGTTLIQREIARRRKEDDISNELNLFYVACTRAMCSLHIMCCVYSDPYDEENVSDATNYYQLVDFPSLTGYHPKKNDVFPDGITRYEGQLIHYATIGADTIKSADTDGETVEPVSDNTTENLNSFRMTDKVFLDCMRDVYEKEYHNKESLGLPAKSSATKLRGTHKGVKNDVSDDDSDENEIVATEKSDRDRGTAYHKFLELCDFSIKDVKGIEAELSEIMPDEETKKLVSAENLSKILSMSAFENVPQKFYRERKFRCLLKACDVKKTDSEDEILVDGIIDFMAVERGRVRIVDYKYSENDKKELVEEYYDQLKIYKMAVSKILGIPSENISTTLINIDRLEEIPLDIKF